MSEKKSWSGIFWGISGGFIGILGVFLLGYSLFSVVSKTESQKISEILPAKNLQFFLTYTKNDEKTSPEETFLSSLFPELLLKNGVLVSYSSQEGLEEKNNFLWIELVQENIPAPQKLYCEAQSDYWFCAKPEEKTEVFVIIDQIKNNAPPLSIQKEFLDAQSFFEKEDVFTFFGTTHFFVNTFLKNFNFLLPEEIQHSVFVFLQFGSDHSHYTAGKFSNGKIFLAIQKENTGKIFGSELSQYNFSSDFLSNSVDRYLAIQKPEIVWNTFFPLFEKEHIDTSFVAQASVEKYFSSSLLKKNVDIDFSSEIFPLFAGDVLWAEDAISSAVFYSLPKKSISEKVFESFSAIIDTIAKESVPLKVGHLLQDGTMIYEVFSNEENLMHKKESDKNGEKVVFTNTNPETGEKYSVGIINRDTFLMISDGEKFLHQFWEISEKGSSFSFPKNSNTFFSFG